MSHNLEGQWINFLISCKYFKGGQMPPPLKEILIITYTEYSLTYIVGEEDDEEWSDEVIDTLDVSAGRVTHRPDKQDPLKTLLYDLLLEERNVWVHARNIDGDLGKCEV